MPSVAAYELDRLTRACAKELAQGSSSDYFARSEVERLSPLLYDCFDRLGWPDTVPEDERHHFRKAYYASAGRNVDLLDALGNAAEALLRTGYPDDRRERCGSRDQRLSERRAPPDERHRPLCVARARRSSGGYPDGARIPPLCSGNDSRARAKDAPRQAVHRWCSRQYRHRPALVVSRRSRRCSRTPFRLASRLDLPEPLAQFTDSRPLLPQTAELHRRDGRDEPERVLNELTTLPWHARWALLRALVLPSVSYMRFRYPRLPRWAWPLAYPLRWAKFATKSAALAARYAGRFARREARTQPLLAPRQSPDHRKSC